MNSLTEMLTDRHGVIMCSAHPPLPELSSLADLGGGAFFSPKTLTFLNFASLAIHFYTKCLQKHGQNLLKITYTLTINTFNDLPTPFPLSKSTPPPPVKSWIRHCSSYVLVITMLPFVFTGSDYYLTIITIIHRIKMHHVSL